MLYDKQVRNDVDLKSLLNRLPVQVGRSFLGMEYSSRDKGSMDESVVESFLLKRFGKTVCSRSDTVLGCEVQKKEV